MKISQHSDLTPAVAQNSQASTARAGQTAQTSVKNESRASGVEVTVPSRARSLEQTGNADTPEVDMDKVNAARQAIEQKTFTVNPHAIADKLLANAREMLNRSRS